VQERAVNRRAFLIATIILVACTESSAPSLVNLIATPSEYANRAVRVQGFLSAGGSGLALYLTREHAENFDHASSIDVADATSDGYLTLTCSGGHAVVDATFRRVSEAPRFASDSPFFILADVERVLIRRGGGELEQCWPRE